ncbi:MAG: hypothetical protein VXW15_02055 [Bdellovibrionota bacterium]|nr:hypothetical protein [Bdellovibrionota bacterium]
MNFSLFAKHLTLIMAFSVSLFAEAFNAKKAGLYYFKEPFGIVHEKADLESPSIKVIYCGQPLEIIETYGQKSIGEWTMVKRRKLEGFIQTKFLSKRWPACFTRTFSQFVGEFQMSETDLYFWAKYVERVRRGRSKVK